MTFLEELDALEQAFDGLSLTTGGPDTVRAIIARLRALASVGEPAAVSSVLQNKLDDMNRAYGILESQYRELRLKLERVNASPADTGVSVTGLDELEKAEHAARDINSYLTWQLSDESPGCHPTFRSAVAAFRGAFAPEVFAPGSSRFDEWQDARRSALSPSPSSEEEPPGWKWDEEQKTYVRSALASSPPPAVTADDPNATPAETMAVSEGWAHWLDHEKHNPRQRFFAACRAAIRAMIDAPRSAGTAGERWYLGSMNDGLFIINKPPRPSNDDVWHDRPDGPTMALALESLSSKRAQAIVDAHNATLPPNPPKTGEGK